jgi:hypothetical protein
MAKLERERFLANPYLAVIGIEEPGLSPRVVPLWYDYKPSVGFSIIVKKQSKKLKLLQAAKRFSLCVQEPQSPYKHVSAQGPIIEIRTCVDRVDLLTVATKYLGEKDAKKFLINRTPHASLVLIMQPEQWITADYS